MFEICFLFFDSFTAAFDVVLEVSSEQAQVLPQFIDSLVDFNSEFADLLTNHILGGGVCGFLNAGLSAGCRVDRVNNWIVIRVITATIGNSPMLLGCMFSVLVFFFGVGGAGDGY